MSRAQSKLAATPHQKILKVKSLTYALALTALALALLQASGAEAPAKAGPAEPEPPNILVIYMDDMRWDDLQFMPIVESLLQDQGVTFGNSFVTTSLCCPSRASLLTGQYVHNHGVWTNAFPEGGFLKFDDSVTLATQLDAAGYQTAFIGRYLNEYHNQTINRGVSYIPPGWDHWYAISHAYYRFKFNDNGLLGRVTAEDYSTDVLADRAAQFITTAAPTADPFFVWLSIVPPHEWPDPAQRHADSCLELEPVWPAAFNEADVSDKPWRSGVCRNLVRTPRTVWTGNVSCERAPCVPPMRRLSSSSRPSTRQMSWTRRLYCSRPTTAIAWVNTATWRAKTVSTRSASECRLWFDTRRLSMPNPLVKCCPTWSST